VSGCRSFQDTPIFSIVPQKKQAKESKQNVNNTNLSKELKEEQYDTYCQQELKSHQAARL
jgi:hypothetical protein